VFNKLFKSTPRKEELPGAPSSVPDFGDLGDNGWVELTGGRLVAHDPVGDGRFATISAEGPVRVWINGEDVSGVSVVTSGDEIRWELNSDPGSFAEITLADDGMSATMKVTSDAIRLPDTITLSGQAPAVVRPGYSPRARQRIGSPKQHILDQMAVLGITAGIDEAAIDRELADPTGRPAVIARGQEAVPFRSGRWVWRLNEWALTEPGQVVAISEGGQPAKPRTTVQGETVHVYQQPAEAEGFLAGKGTRLVGGTRIVAAMAGRAHRVPMNGAFQVDIVPVQTLNGSVDGELSAKADIIVRGNVLNAKITTPGEILVTGSVEKSELRAEGIVILGDVFQTLLMTLPTGHYLPLKAELQFIQHRVIGLRRLLEGDRHLREQLLKDMAIFVRALRRRADEMGVDHPAFQKVMADLARTFSTLDGGSVFTLATADVVLSQLEAMLNAPTPAGGSGGVSARSMAHGRVWAAGDVEVEDRCSGCSIYAGGSMRTPPAAVVTQSDIVAGEQVQAGILATMNGATPVTIRARRAEVEEVQPGAAFEFGASRRDFKVDKGRTMAGINASGQILVKHVS
jgi:hypothetical protein